MTTAILQARMGSTRLPGKMLLPVWNEKGALELMLERVLRARTLDRVIVATTDLAEDEPIEKICRRIGVPVFRGHPLDVLDRYYRCAKTLAKDDVLVRLTGDCPLHDPGVIDQVVTFFQEGTFDYAANTHPATFPDGLDAEVFSFEALERAFLDATLVSEREHVTYYLYTHPEIFRLGNLSNPEDYSSLRWTLDEPADLEFIRRIYTLLAPANPVFAMNDVLQALRTHPGLAEINQGIERNEGLKKSLAQDYEQGNLK